MFTPGQEKRVVPVVVPGAVRPTIPGAGVPPPPPEELLDELELLELALPLPLDELELLELALLVPLDELELELLELELLELALLVPLDELELELLELDLPELELLELELLLPLDELELVELDPVFVEPPVIDSETSDGRPVPVPQNPNDATLPGAMAAL